VHAKDATPGQTLDIIDPDTAGTLDGLFRARVAQTPDAVAYRHYDHAAGMWTDSTWGEIAAQVTRWQAGLRREPLHTGDRVAVMMANRPEWVIFEQAALGLGLVVVPLYCNDRADNVAYILENADVKLLLVEGAEQWERLKDARNTITATTRVVSLDAIDAPTADARTRCIAEWLPDEDAPLRAHHGDPDALASIVYTSGTTGRSKGVMLSHRNILWNAGSGMRHIAVYREDLFLSVLPLSHTLERTVGHYIPMMAGATVAYARSPTLLAEDLEHIRPTVFISVPRIFERAHRAIDAQARNRSSVLRRLLAAATRSGWARFERRQHRARWHWSLLAWPLLDRLVARKVRARFGGRLRCVICGGAPLSHAVAEFFLALGIPLQQGYGLTETSPVISVNRLEDNDPASVGTPLTDVQVAIGPAEELLVKSPGMMLGYWADPGSTAAMIDTDGWLHTGDKARLNNGHIYITGRLKEIIVLSNGEKIPPADMEMAIETDPLFDQVMVLGEGRPYLGCLVVLNRQHWEQFARHRPAEAGEPIAVDNKTIIDTILERISQRLRDFPGYAQVRRAVTMHEPWTVENGLLTPTLKLRRDRILAHCKEQVAELYKGH